LTLLELIPDLDCRKYRKNFDDPIKNEKDFNDWKDCHLQAYKWQSVIRREYLHNFYPVRAYDLALALRRDHLLGWDTINSIVQHLIHNNRFVDVDRLNQDDERKFHLRRFPRLPENLQVPYSLLPMTYYENMRKSKGISIYDELV
jgi:hypothetical protein